LSSRYARAAINFPGTKNRNTRGFSHQTPWSCLLAHSPDLAQAVLAGFKSLDGAYTEVRKAKQSLDAQVVGNVRRKVARSKKVAVLPEIELAKLPAAEQRSVPDAAKIAERVSAITAYSARDPEEPKTTDGSEEIELGKVIAGCGVTSLAMRIPCASAMP
jgi:hypothetical protein